MSLRSGPAGPVLVGPVGLVPVGPVGPVPVGPVGPVLVGPVWFRSVLFFYMSNCRVKMPPLVAGYTDLLLRGLTPPHAPHPL